MAGLILLPIFPLFLLCCALLLLSRSLAIREKLFLWPVIPLLFIMSFFALWCQPLSERRLGTQGTPGVQDAQGTWGCSTGKDANANSKGNTTCPLSCKKYQPCTSLTLTAAADRGEPHVPSGSHSLRVFQTFPLQSAASPALVSKLSQHASLC